MKELSEEEALYKAAAYCSMAEHCLSEVSEKLENWGVSTEGRTRILKKLETENILMKSDTVVLLSMINSPIISGDEIK